MSERERLILNGLDLSTGNFALEAVDFTPPPKKPEWAQAADADGANLIRTPLFENRTITATIRIERQGSMDEALARIGELADMLQEAEKNPNGIPLEWVPANATKAITFYVLTGAITGIPVVVQGEGAGWFAKTPVVTISTTAKPFGYGEEVSAGAAVSNAGEPNVTLTIPNVPGDVPAEAVLIVTDTAGVGRRFVEWGLENRYYNAATKLLLDSEDMTPVGGAQSTALNASGAYKRAGATNGTIATKLLPEPTVCCSTGNLKHVGTFRVKARVEIVLGTGSLIGHVHLRFRWQDGEGTLRANAWQTPVLGGVFVEVDLGIVTINPAIVGTQKWLGQIEAYSENEVIADTQHIDYLTFVPVLEGYGKARGTLVKEDGACEAFDNFTTGTLSGNLNGRTAPLPEAGKWTTAGATTDFAVTTGNISRATTLDAGPRTAVLGPLLTNMRVTAALKPTAILPTVGVIATRTGATSYVRFVYRCNVGSEGEITLDRVAGGIEPFSAAAVPAGITVESLTITALSDGSLVGELITTTGTYIITANNAVTGGTPGAGGILDFNSSASAMTRIYTSLTIAELGEIPYCIQRSRSMQVRSDSAITADSTGTYYGPVPEYRGSRFYLPQAGQAKRTSRILVKADRKDLEESDQQVIGDNFTAQVVYTPRYHAVPR